MRIAGFDYDVVSAAFEEVGYQTDIEFCPGLAP